MATTTTDKAQFKVGDETFQTWYQVTGDLHSGKRPLVALHGGPGVPHSYMLAHLDLYTSYNIPVVLYDQLGCGKSTHLREKPKEFWTVDLFMNELSNLLDHIGITEDFDLLGHSWGGMLASSYAALRHPPGLKHLIIADSPASMPLWEETTAALLAEFPEETRETLRRHEEAGTTDSQEYQEAVMEFYKKHVCRLEPWPQEIQESFKGLSEDPTVYHTMNGPSEFTVVGSLKTWSIIDALPNIKSPTLVINGEHDEAQELCVRPFRERIPNAKWAELRGCSHMPFWEGREEYFQLVGDFLGSG
ncbi:hypothetical protein HGRIS_001958 [Hohenbuehelia grisea]|uniref:AB hydrolase-1 domain-containing protein n=1 Tax=Hohenbuehelia grisea TaxID=104357 RepID=A0ABR3JK62_9AGAR